MPRSPSRRARRGLEPGRSTATARRGSARASTGRRQLAALVDRGDRRRAAVSRVALKNLDRSGGQLHTGDTRAGPDHVSAPNLTPSRGSLALDQGRPGPTSTPRPITELRTMAPASTTARRTERTRTRHRRRHAHAPAEDGVRPDPRAGVDLAVGVDQHRRRTLPSIRRRPRAHRRIVVRGHRSGLHLGSRISRVAWR